MSLSAETKKKIASAAYRFNYNRQLTVGLQKQLTASETTELICNQKTDVENNLIEAAEDFYDSLKSQPYEHVSGGQIHLDCLDLWNYFLEAAAEHQNR